MKIEINIDESTLSTLFKEKTRKEKPISFSKSLDLMWDHDKRCIRLKKERSSTFNLDNKLVGYCFAQKCGFVTPKIYQVGIPLSEVNFRNGVVVKPMYESSARGVVIVYSEDNIVYLNKNEKYSSISEVKTYLKKLIK
ncbi:hypothetical protein [Ignatzschineria cameli]|uniref:Uncharacterized protein n=1 Tax=Ignatzschineria cameli TaxID=2182793 RepID=A0A2U2ASM4_9GAMM|nr:hypothetical protein [Ignatzschineria cameli]PWD87743.1 hypothetical protein DC077_00190 [Ignatzschineria cameli]